MHNRNKQLHQLLNQKGLQAQKATLVLSFTNGRSESSKELTDTEALHLCIYLQEQPDISPLTAPKTVSASYITVQKQRRKIIAIAHNMGWKLDDGKADMERVNEWCKQQFGKCMLNDYNQEQLPLLVSIFEKVYKQFLKAI